MFLTNNFGELGGTKFVRQWRVFRRARWCLQAIPKQIAHSTILPEQASWDAHERLKLRRCKTDLTRSNGTGRVLTDEAKIGVGHSLVDGIPTIVERPLFASSTVLRA